MVVNPALQVKAWGPGELKSLNNLEYELYLKHGIFFFFFFNIRLIIIYFYIFSILSIPAPLSLAC